MTANAKLREAIIVALSQPMSKRVSAVEALFQAHQQELLSGILGELPEKYPEPTQAPDGSIIDEYKLAFNIAISEVVSAIERYREGL